MSILTLLERVGGVYHRANSKEAYLEGRLSQSCYASPGSTTSLTFILIVALRLPDRFKVLLLLLLLLLELLPLLILLYLL